MRATQLFLLVLLHAAASVAEAQDSLFVVGGARVRYAAEEPGQIWSRRFPAPRAPALIGTVVDVRGDSVRIQLVDTGDTAVIAATALARLEVSRGVHRQSTRGARVGAGIGSLAGALYAFRTFEPDECSDLVCIDFEGPLRAAFIGGGIGLVGGALAGHVIGSLVKAEEWRPARLERGVERVSVVPTPGGGATLAVIVRF